MAVILSRGTRFNATNNNSVKIVPKYTNCVNCGAVLTSLVCKYCDTEYSAVKTDNEKAGREIVIK